MTVGRDLSALRGIADPADAPDRRVLPPPATAPRSGDAADRTAAPPPSRQRRATRRTPEQRSATIAPAARQKTRTVRISVHVPLACRQWLTDEARTQGRFISDVLLEALDRHVGDSEPPVGRAKRAVVPNGVIHGIVLPTADRSRIDEIVERLGTSRSALITEVLRRAMCSPSASDAGVAPR